MIGFAPGELSTIKGPVEFEFFYQPRQQFDPKDLPCPPQRVMVSNLGNEYVYYTYPVFIVRELVYTHTRRPLSSLFRLSK